MNNELAPLFFFVLGGIVFAIGFRAYVDGWLGGRDDS